MQLFTGWDYLLIDVANQFGHDKELFADRIQWTTENLEHLEELADEADERALYLKGVQAIRKAQQGVPTGHMIGFDAVCSGMQIMSTLTGCEAGANATGLVDPNRRADAYTDCTGIMQRFIPTLPDNERKKIKQAVMTVLYGSKREPKNLFGEGTEELNAFYKAMGELAPGAVELLEDLLNSWQPFALSHEWVLPDGYEAKVKVMTKVEKRLEVDELDHATFSYEYYVNEGQEKGLSNVANVVHSIDAYVLRSLIRRCNYDHGLILWASEVIEMVLLERATGVEHSVDTYWLDDDFNHLRERYEATQMPDIRILDYCGVLEIKALSSDHLRALANIVNSMLEHKPFPIVSVHDEFKCHANNMNWLRLHYRDIFAEMADSTILDDVLSQLYGTQGHFPKKSPNLAAKIRNSNYALS
ncbi:DNA-directed RNA polymerase [uncultured Marinobacter sp.]|uniref:DNA-directed RNA polymerase n=1 Tax=uncultured Marinobacter sp. TaxID=187379 RepID=UPI00259A7985|nr:DNA-directed RNA polymerase [uncultured Marinobacter sp.]